MLCNVVRIIIGSLKLAVRYFFVCLVIDINGVCKGESEYLRTTSKVSIYCELDRSIKQDICAQILSTSVVRSVFCLSEMFSFGYFGSSLEEAFSWFGNFVH